MNILHRLKRLAANREGASVIEFALAMPVAAALMIGILQFALVLQATGAIRHAAGEGVRYANVHPGATERQVSDKVRKEMAGLNEDGIVRIALERGISDGAQFDKIAIEYRLEPVVPFMQLEPISLNETVLSYVQS